MILGYDARELWMPLADYWSAERRETYLLRTGVERPKSVDDRVWRSVFGEFPDLIPDFVGPYQNLWIDLGQLAGAVAPLKERGNRFVIIAVQLCEESCSAEQCALWLESFCGVHPVGVTGPRPEPMVAVPSVPSNEWRSLGYDVADDGGTSALMNCGYLPDEVGPLTARWREALNEHHLFADMTDAIRFRDLSNDRVQEHAPFYVYRLWDCDPAEQAESTRNGQ